MSACEGQFCSEIQRYYWHLYKLQDSVPGNPWIRVENLEGKILTELDSPSFVIAGRRNSEASLQENSTYKAVALAHINEEFAVEGQFSFVTNLSPHHNGEGRGCFVTPQQGVALSTEFVMECVGWQDPDQPLTYQFSFRTSNTGLLILQMGLNDTLKSGLPVGNPSHDFNLTLEMQVSDSLGSSKRVVHVVKVRERGLTAFKP